jgi:hypothetical protein
MPAKGTRKVPKKEKAQIIAEKRVKTAQQVAAAHGIAPRTVYSIEAKATPELLAMADDYHDQVVEQGQMNVLAGLRTMYPKMCDPDTPLKELTPAVKVNHDIVQVQRGLPTQINGSTDDQARKLNELFTLLMAQTRKNEDGSAAKCTPEQAYRLIGAMPVPGVDEGFKKRWAEGELAKVQQLSGENNA